MSFRHIAIPMHGCDRMLHTSRVNHLIEKYSRKIVCNNSQNLTRWNRSLVLIWWHWQRNDFHTMIKCCVVSSIWLDVNSVRADFCIRTEATEGCKEVGDMHSTHCIHLIKTTSNYSTEMRKIRVNATLSMSLAAAHQVEIYECTQLVLSCKIFVQDQATTARSECRESHCCGWLKSPMASTGWWCSCRCSEKRNKYLDCMSPPFRPKRKQECSQNEYVPLFRIEPNLKPYKSQNAKSY